ncbi:MAG: hypothetical protein WDN31_12600 [Hyphomicrobium sp.]
MLAAARRHLVPIDAATAAAGDVLIFRLRSGAMAKHAAILASAKTMIHATEGARVSEVPLSPVVAAAHRRRLRVPAKGKLMATLALAAAGAAVGGAVLPGGVTLLGATLTGATIGSQVGAIAGSVVDQALLGGAGKTRQIDGPRLSELHITASTEGAAIPRAYGRVRLGGQVIWATPFEEEVVTSSSGGGGGKGIGAAAPSGTSTEYRYYANFAVALCEGEISGIGRLWADGVEIDRAQINHRVYLGGEEQEGDQPHHRPRGCRQRARLPWHRLRGVRAPGAGAVRQPPAAALLRGLSRGRHVRRRHPRGGAHPRLGRVRLFPAAGDAARRPSPAPRPKTCIRARGGSDWTVAIDQLQETLPAHATCRSSSAGSAPTCAPVNASCGRGWRTATRSPIPSPGRWRARRGQPPTW